jgi:hypothetical protein
MTGKALVFGAALLLIVAGYALGQTQQNHCRFALVIAHNEEMGLLVLGLGQPLAPSVSISRPIEPFWPGVMVCMRPPTDEEAALRDSLP